MNLPNFEGVLQKKAGVYTKNFQVRGGPGPCQSPPVSATAPEPTRGCVVIFYILKYCSTALLFILVDLHVSFSCTLHMLPLLLPLLGAKCQSP
jgi:hypothetical protein